MLLLIVLLLAVTVDSLTDPSVPDMFFPFGTDEGDSVVPVGDDYASPAVNIPVGFPFLYGNYTTVFVSSKVHLLSCFTYSSFCHSLSYTFAAGLSII